MRWLTEIPEPDSSAGTRLILLEAPPGPARRRYLGEWILEAREAGSSAWHLPCDASFGGPWAGVREVVRELVPLVESKTPELLERHALELRLTLPTIRDKLVNVPLTLTDTAIDEERVRNYPMDRAYRNVQGLVEFLASWQEQVRHPAWVMACEDYDDAGALGGRFFHELMRRCGRDLNLTLLLAGRPGAFADKVFEGDFELVRVRPSLPDEPEEQPSPSEMAARAERLEKEFEKDVAVMAERLTEVIYYWLRSDTPERALQWQGHAFADYNHLGFYEDAVPYGEIVLQHIDEICDNTIYTRWNLVGALCNCHLALRKPERALEIVNREAVPKIDDPTDRARIRYVLGLIHSRFLSTPDLEKAEEYITEGLSILESEEIPLTERIFLRVFTLNGLAFIRHRQGRPEDALDLCKSGFELLGRELPSTQHRLHRSVLLYNTAQVYAALGSTEEAIRYFSEAIEMDSNYSEYHNERANMYLALERLDEAIADYHEAIRLSPPYWEVWTNLGQAYKLQGRADEAIRAYTKALDIDPLQLLPRLGRAQAYELARRPELALDDYKAALDLDPGQPLILANRAEIHYAAGRVEQALDDLDRALALDPENPGFYYNRSVALADLQQPEKAVEDLRNYLRLLPDAEDREDVEEKIEALTRGGTTGSRSGQTLVADQVS